MPAKTEILRRLEQESGSYLSGEQLAQALGVSRAAVWKAVSQLKKEGYPISAVTNRGYCLESGADLLTEQAVRAALPERYAQIALRVEEELPSTNRTARQWAMDGAPDMAAVLCKRQTEGRGRLGRKFASPEGGVYLSVVLRPERSAADSALLTTAAAVAVCRAIEGLCGRRAQVKWVNDIYCGGRKVCGILTEAVTDFESGQVESIVLGIGVNLSTPGDALPEEMCGMAGSLFPQGDAPVTRARLAAEILAQVFPLWERLEQKAFLGEYRERCFVLGREIQVLQNGACYSATALTVDDCGGLVVRTADGGQRTLHGGEISVRATSRQ